MIKKVMCAKCREQCLACSPHSNISIRKLLIDIVFKDEISWIFEKDFLLWEGAGQGNLTAFLPFQF